MTDTARILIVEDDLPLARTLARFLGRDGYQVAIARSGAEMRRVYRDKGADLVLLDLNLGAEDGLDIARELAQKTPVGVIIITGRGDLEDRIRGLDAGADDYMTKPIDQRELRARVRAVLRRQLPDLEADARIRLGPAVLDLGRRELRCDGVAPRVELTEMQATILGQLMRHAGRPVGRGELLQRAYWSPVDRSADVHVGHIRRKLDEAGIDALAIRAVRGHGYCLTLAAEAAGLAEQEAGADG
jgi:DNA-binding response OmpR family regulator